jgi:predicted nucleotidyltransferase
MDLAQPYKAICPTLDSAILSVLARTSRALTGREIARLVARRSHAGVLAVLHRLVEHGLVDEREAGRALLFTLNREHLAAPAVDVLANMRAELLHRLRTAIAAWEIAPVNASLFGSMARGTGDTRSDVDILLVRPTAIAEDDAGWRDQLDHLAVQVKRWTGNPAGLVEVGQSELGQLAEDAPPIFAELRSDAIALHGVDIRTQLEGGS